MPLARISSTGVLGSSTRFVPSALWIRTLTLMLALGLAGCSKKTNKPPTPDAGSSPVRHVVAPLDGYSPWPKFRGDEVQDGRGVFMPVRDDSLKPWSFATGKGVFSSPVIGDDETVYVGSADQNFYAINADGSERFRVPTGEIIDSSALLDDQGRVYFGSGDGHLYGIDAKSGQQIWTFSADPPARTGAYINWFEGNVAMGLDGTLYVPNDNFRVYAVRRDVGGLIWAFTMPDQTWSSPAVDTQTGAITIGNNNTISTFGPNLYGISPDGGTRWADTYNGTIAASPMLLPDLNRFVVGCFDGYVRAFDENDGGEAWSFPTRDHIYASPARLLDGSVVQPSADGTVYAIDPSSGAMKWAFDTHDPIRSSPAVDAAGNVYFGGGDGRLYVLNPDGTLRWRMLLVNSERNDVNSSPALGRRGVYVGAESGEVFFVPYDYCLGTAGLADSRCDGPSIGEDLPANGVNMVYTSQFGSLIDTPPSVIDPNQTLAFSLVARKDGDTELALIDDANLSVNITPPTNHSVVVSADRKFALVVPESPFQAGPDGGVSIELSGDYLVNPERTGLKFTGGDDGGQFDTNFNFSFNPPGPTQLPYAVPQDAGDPSGSFELYRLAAPMPTILPSYDQIGFDSEIFLAGMVEGDSNRSIAWLVGGKPGAAGGTDVVDPASLAQFPVVVTYDHGWMTLDNEDGFSLQVTRLSITFQRFRASTRLDAQGNQLVTPTLYVSTQCSGIPFYGSFLEALGFCNPVTDNFSVLGAALLRPLPTAQSPAGLGTVAFTRNATTITATLTGSSLKQLEHSWGLLLVDTATSTPVSIAYGQSTTVNADGNGVATSVQLQLPTTTAIATVRAYLMVDTFPAAVATLTP